MLNHRNERHKGVVASLPQAGFGLGLTMVAAAVGGMGWRPALLLPLPLLGVRWMERRRDGT